MQNQSQLEHDLEQRHKMFKSSSPHDIFELWPGCGRQALQERYYELVKTHHPDRYGGNLSSKLKKLSQSIFLQIQDAYQELSKVEDGPQQKPPPASERAAALNSLSGRSGKKPSKSSSQYQRMRRTGQQERLTNKSIFEAVTISERDASTLEEDSMPEEERRAKLAKLARTARKKSPRPPIAAVIQNRFDSLEEDSALSVQDRRDKLAALSSRKKGVPAGFKLAERPDTGVTSGLKVEAAVPLADSASSGTIRGITSDEARHQSDIPSHQEEFSRGVSEMREGRYTNAFPLVDTAYKKEPQNGLYKTYYAYLLFMTSPDRKKESEEMLRDVINQQSRQTAPDANLFLGFILKTYEQERYKKMAHKLFKKALELNPSNHEAAREVRLYEMRQKQQEEVRMSDDVGGFFKKLFKK